MEIAPPPLRSRRVLTIHAGLNPARGRNTYSYTTAPKTPPRSGPSQYTHQLSKKPDATAGPSHRPGLIAAPVKYPPKSQSTPTVSPIGIAPRVFAARSEEHTSELQSPCNLVCRLLLEKKKIRFHIYASG